VLGLRWDWRKSNRNKYTVINCVIEVINKSTDADGHDAEDGTDNINNPHFLLPE
jgi:hypothetical protein